MSNQSAKADELTTKKSEAEGQDEWLELLELKPEPKPTPEPTPEPTSKPTPEPTPETNPEPNPEPMPKCLKVDSVEYMEWLEAQIE